MLSCRCRVNVLEVDLESAGARRLAGIGAIRREDAGLTANLVKRDRVLMTPRWGIGDTGSGYFAARNS
jgi:hypothetical protein